MNYEMILDAITAFGVVATAIISWLNYRSSASLRNTIAALPSSAVKEFEKKQEKDSTDQARRWVQN